MIPSVRDGVINHNGGSTDGVSAFNTSDGVLGVVFSDPKNSVFKGNVLGAVISASPGVSKEVEIVNNTTVDREEPIL